MAATNDVYEDLKLKAFRLHQAWKSRLIDWEEIHKVELEIKTVPCDRCGCFGNKECKHECVDIEKNCTLSSNMVCPCCLYDAKVKASQTIKDKTGSIDLFEKTN